MLPMPAIFPSIGATFGRLSFLGDGGLSPGRTRRWRFGGKLAALIFLPQ